MKKITRFLALSALIAGVSVLGNGCIVSDCEDEDGNTIDNCVQGESVTIYQGSEETQSVAYAAGTDLVVQSVNGKVVVDRYDGTDVRVTFFPKTGGGNAPEDKEEAKREMQEDLQLQVSESGGQIVVSTNRDGGNTYLGADIKVELPDSFDGGVQIDQNNGFVDVDLDGLNPASVTIDNDGAGDVDLEGARGPLDIEGDFDLNVTIAAWPAVDGRIVSKGGTGDITVVVPAGAHGSIQATASDDGVVQEPSSLPSDWVVDAAAENSKTFSFGDVSGGNIVVSTDPTGLGDVVIEVGS